MPDVDTTNKFVVSVLGNGSVVILAPPRGPLSQDDALLLAAYLVALAAAPRERFLEILHAVENA